MKIKKEYVILLAIFFIVFASRLYFSLQSDYFSDTDSYFVLRQVESISENGKPLLEDPLSYGGRTLLFSPVMHYFYSFFYSFKPDVSTLKIISNLFASTIVLTAFLVSFYIIKNKDLSLIIALMAGFLPIYYENTVNSLNVFSIFMPLMLLCIYFLLKLKSNLNKYALWTISTTFLLIILTPMSIVFIFGLFIFLMIQYIEDIKLVKAEIEIVFVSFFLYLWFNFILYKKALIFHGINVIWQNIPNRLLQNFFQSLNIIQIIYSIGIIAFLFGVYIIYKYVTLEKSRDIYLLLGFALSIFFILWFRLIPFIAGIIFLGVILSILSAEGFKIILDYINKTVVSKYSKILFFAIISIIVLTSIIPSITSANNIMKKVPQSDLIDTLGWIKENTPQDSAVFSSLNEGHYISYFANRKNIMDTNYLFIKEVNQRQKDIDTVYTTIFYTDAAAILKDYKSKYLLVTPQTMESYGLKELRFDTEDCFFLRYEKNSVRLYEVFC